MPHPVLKGQTSMQSLQHACSSTSLPGLGPEYMMNTERLKPLEKLLTAEFLRTLQETYERHYCIGLCWCQMPCEMLPHHREPKLENDPIRQSVNSDLPLRTLQERYDRLYCIGVCWFQKLTTGRRSWKMSTYLFNHWTLALVLFPMVVYLPPWVCCSTVPTSAKNVADGAPWCSAVVCNAGGRSAVGHCMVAARVLVLVPFPFVVVGLLVPLPFGVFDLL